MSDTKHVRVGPVTIGNDLPFVLISGPCQIESRDHALFMADALAKAASGAGVPFIFKSSFDKANRTSVSGKRGVGIDAGLAILADVKAALGCPVLTDIHGPDQVEAAAQAVDILQIPAFLCRQTDLLLAAGRSGAVINVKKGQFLAPWDMAAVAQKVASTGNERILLTERGASFGYNTLVSDMRALPVMAQTGYPVVFDATHSVQQPGGLGSASGGQREFAPLLARSAVAAGVAAIFAEAHDDPDHAPSDGPVMLPLDWVGPMLRTLKAIDAMVKG
ncbi:MAG: 3-deoxy-8-phosphooctulonate synthase [Pseudomonadota bacterium]|uniref:3-deoxy-8-phosphooctulonate synthase n=1 Tax=Sphingobium naphthae TaxID=1886786 RepID=UPI002B08C2CA|nr:3-deoxy-8-phosphooctulonate synthase [Pseudomonadota bacterium]